MTRRLRVSVILCTKDRPDDVRLVFQCLGAQTLLPAEVVVVDASGDDRTRLVVLEKEGASPARYLHVTRPGLTRQRNIGIREATGDLLLFVDDDVVLEPDYVECVAAAFRQDAAGRVGAVQGRVTNYLRARTTFGARLRGRVLSLLLRAFLLPRVGSGWFQASTFPTYPYDQETPRFVECLHGCAMSFRREVFQALSFDEDLTGSGCLEDADIAHRLTARYAIYYEPRAQLRHLLSPVARGSAVAQTRQLMLHHAYLLETRWPFTWQRWLAGWWSRLGLCIVYAAALDWASLTGAVAGIVAVLRRAAPLGRGPGP